MLARSFSHMAIARNSSPRSGWVVERPFFSLATVQHPALDLHLIEFELAGFRHPQPVAEHQQQQATVAGLVAAALGSLSSAIRQKEGEAA
jgi:hypothetical protein